MKSISIVVLATFCLQVVSCATINLPKAPKPYTAKKESELIRAPLEVRAATSLPKKTFGRAVLLKDSKASEDGLLLDAHEVGRLGLVKKDRDTLRMELLAEKRLRNKTKHIYDKALWEAEVRFIKSQPSFWERHTGKIGLIVGVVLGGAFAVGMAAGFSAVK